MKYIHEILIASALAVTVLFILITTSAIMIMIGHTTHHLINLIF